MFVTFITKGDKNCYLNLTSIYVCILFKHVKWLKTKYLLFIQKTLVEYLGTSQGQIGFAPLLSIFLLVTYWCALLQCIIWFSFSVYDLIMLCISVTPPMYNMIFLQCLWPYCALYFGPITLTWFALCVCLCDIGCKGHVWEIRPYLCE